MRNPGQVKLHSPEEEALLRTIYAKAKCANIDRRIFFPEEGEGYKPAIQICATCPVRAECAAYAIDAERFGMWGGLNPNDRKILKKARALDHPEWIGEHGNGEASFKQHLHRGEIPCDPCFQSYAQEVPDRRLPKATSGR